jgi:hypothetical protein
MLCFFVEIAMIAISKSTLKIKKGGRNMSCDGIEFEVYGRVVGFYEWSKDETVLIVLCDDNEKFLPIFVSKDVSLRRGDPRVWSKKLNSQQIFGRMINIGGCIFFCNCELRYFATGMGIFDNNDGTSCAAAVYENE